MIKTPDIIPNNLRSIRETRGRGTDETANALGMNRSYVSILENAKANMSGETALNIMNYFNCNFATLFEKEGKHLLEHSTETFNYQLTKIIITQKQLAEYRSGDIIEAVKMIEKEFKKYNIPGSVHDLEEVSCEEISGTEKLALSLKVTVVESKVDLVEFDLGLTYDINLELYKKLKDRGFKDNEYFSIKFIENALGITEPKTQEALGLSEKGYLDIINGEKRIPVKIMWRLVKFFKVPLEMIMNIPLYRENVLYTHLN